MVFSEGTRCPKRNCIRGAGQPGVANISTQQKFVHTSWRVYLVFRVCVALSGVQDGGIQAFGEKV